LARTNLLSWPSVKRGYVEMHPEFIGAADEDPRAFLETVMKSGFHLTAGHPNGPPVIYRSDYTVMAGDYYFQKRASAVGR
jgi:hypothetical protein